MGAINHPARQPVPPAAVSRVLASFTRAELEGFVEVAIGLMDLADGNPDLEPNDDELDGSMGEDDFCDHNLVFAGPGCPISDPDTAVDDEGEREEYA